MSANDQVDLLAKLEIALLLFVVGLKLDIKIIRTMGPVHWLLALSDFSELHLIHVWRAYGENRMRSGLAYQPEALC